jgi:hypothetical protein
MHIAKRTSLNRVAADRNLAVFLQHVWIEGTEFHRSMQGPATQAA